MREEAERQLRVISKDLVRASKKARRRGKPRDWHRLRTTSRQLRGALTAFASALPPASRPELARRAKKITKLPARVRDLDVALGNLDLLREQASDKPERRAAREMSSRLARKRDERDRAARKRLRRKHPEKRLARAIRAALRGDRAARPAPSPASSEALGPPARMVLDRRAAVTGWEDDEGLHALRVAVKHYRGALAAWLDAHPGHTRQQRGTVETLKRIQSVLGEHHDWSELARRLDRRRLALASDGARHRDLIGYEGLLARARQQQKSRYEVYRQELHDQIPALVEMTVPDPPAPQRERTAAIN